MEPLKEMFNKTFYEQLSASIYRAYPDLNKSKFIKEVTSGLESFELNQRLRNTSVVLKNHLPDDLRKSIQIMKKVIVELKPGYTNLIFPDYIGLYGKDDLKLSLDALKFFTQYGSSEFAIREFLKTDFDRTLDVMHEWALDKNVHVRRLASEGSRPRLPWSFKLDKIISEPKLTSNILNSLKADEELYVKKSVANHLNDISKDHPDYVINIVKKWKGASPHTDWIVKHASRTLLKKGNEQALSNFGLKYDSSLKCLKFKTEKDKIQIGEQLTFSFSVQNTSRVAKMLRLEYAMYFKVSGEKLSRKVFKISERQIQANEKLEYKKSHSFKRISTRNYYTGEHKIALMINGKEIKTIKFQLTD